MPGYPWGRYTKYFPNKSALLQALLAAMAGVSRALLERGGALLNQETMRAMEQELVALMRAYLQASAEPLRCAT